jgi:hypothetical protein
MPPMGKVAEVRELNGAKRCFSELGFDIASSSFCSNAVKYNKMVTLKERAQFVTKVVEGGIEIIVVA